MNTYEQQISGCIESHELSKKAIQRCLNLMKSGKAKKWLEPMLNMQCVFPLDERSIKANETRPDWNLIVPKPAVSVSLSPYYGELFVYINVYQLSGFTDQRLLSVLETMEYLNPERTDMSEDAASLTKQINYAYVVPFGDSKVTIHACLTAHVKSDSATCKRVAIGVEPGKPRTLYKIVCEDGADQVPTGLLSEEQRMQPEGGEELGNEFP